MNIFEPTVDDIRLLTPSIKKLIERYEGNLHPDPVICIRALYRAVDNADVLLLFMVDEGEIVGYFMGGLTIEMFTGIKIATQIGIMLLPEYRGHMQTILNRFETWAKENRVSRIYTHFSGSNERRDRTMHRKGWVAAEMHYVKEMRYGR